MRRQGRGLRGRGRRPDGRRREPAPGGDHRRHPLHPELVREVVRLPKDPHRGPGGVRRRPAGGQGDDGMKKLTILLGNPSLFYLQIHIY